MKLENLLANLDYQLLKGSLDKEINDIKYNSKEVKPNDLYIAIDGYKSDGHDYIPEAISNKASVIIVSKILDIYGDVTIIKVADTRLALALISKNYFKKPDESLTLIGVTGTTGKTTTTHMIKEILTTSNIKTGLIGSIGITYNDTFIPTKNTTPESYEIYKSLNAMQQNGITHVVIEASSQAFKLHRLYGLTFAIGVLTNATSDHISPTEHENQTEYLACKNKLFLNSKEIVINNDSMYLDKILANVTSPITTYSIDNASDLQAINLNLINDDIVLGSIFSTKGLQNTTFKLNIPGTFNIYNALSAITTCLKLGIDVDIIKNALLKVKVRGRMEPALITKDYKVIIDYAHTEDGLNALVNTLSAYKPKRLISIFGGGGNRAKDRRYHLGEIIGANSDLCILTMDNPRFEEISAINNDIKVGLNKVNAKYIEINDRKNAIIYALDNAKKGDVILLIGKGHETYQDIKGTKYPFSELTILNNYQKEHNL